MRLPALLASGSDPAVPSRTLVAPPLIPTSAAWVERPKLQGIEGSEGSTPFKTNITILLRVRWPKPKSSLQHYTW